MAELSDDHFGGGGDEGSSNDLDLLNLSSDEFPEQRSAALMASGTFEEIRRHDLRSRNICYSIDMIQFVKTKWRELAVKAGEEFTKQLWDTLDVESSAKFRKLVAA
ncbi:hypothetical protein BV898_03557 [Hypsibius exemplaris]|uniref:Uncharacterized protein n=1 Tax=Hypsibius exemplaris TaxID=2072580 RepID=A0A1W0X4Q4_HYPEX|nr:hypothetical protein BV898_03557 [Hypsibius exemplaris]